MPTVLRFTAYTFAVLILTASLPAVVRHFGIGVFQEGAAVEWFQFGLIVVAGAACLAGAVLLARFRRLFVLLACVFTAIGFREQDALLDELLPWIGWKVVFVLVLYAVVSAYTDRRRLISQLPLFVAAGAFAILWGGFLVAFPIAQLIGHGPFLQAAMGEHYVYAYKHMIEELLELMGYLLLLAGSIESVTQLRAARSGAAPVDATADRDNAPAAALTLKVPLPATFGSSAPSPGAAPIAWVRRARKSLVSSHIDMWRRKNI